MMKKPTQQNFIILAIVIIFYFSGAPLINRILRIIPLLLLITVVVNWMMKDWRQAFLYSFFVVVLFEIFIPSKTREYFETSTSSKDNTNKPKEDLKKLDFAKGEDDDDDDDDGDDDFDLKQYVNKLGKMSQLKTKDVLDMNDADDDNDVSSKKNKTIENYSPHDAQVQTYKLINTVKNLQKTMESLAPTLKMGKKIMKTYEKFNLDSHQSR